MASSRRPVSFLLSPTSAITWLPAASRILTSALMASPRLDVTFSAAPVNVYLDSFRRHMRALRDRPVTSAFESYLRLPIRVAPHLDVVAGRHDDRILGSVPTQDVLLSALSIFDLVVAKRLLDAGKRVALGGNLTAIYPPAELRRLLAAIGANRERLARDLVILRGHVTATTDLAALLDAWRDCDVGETDHRSLLSCREDFLLRYLDALQTTNRRLLLAIPLSTGCWYGACEFCTARDQPSLDLTAGLSPDEVLGHLRDLARLYRTTSIVLTDNYPLLTDALEAVLRERAPLSVTVYSGVRLLCDERFVQRLDRCVDGLRIGVESGSDFALKQVHKGFDFQATERAVQNIIDHFDRDKELTLLIVYDLPHESVDDVRRGFARLVAIKARLRAAGFSRVVVSGFPLLSFPGTELLGSSPQLEAAPLADLADEELCGAWTLHRWYEQAHGVRLPAELSHLVTPFRRRGLDGAVLPPDLALLDRATVEELEDPGPLGTAAADSP